MKHPVFVRHRKPLEVSQVNTAVRSSQDIGGKPGIFPVRLQVEEIHMVKSQTIRKFILRVLRGRVEDRLSVRFPLRGEGEAVFKRGQGVRSDKNMTTENE